MINKNKGNYLYLGVAAAYLVIAFMQMSAPGMLPIKVYLSVAWVSLDITLFELIKTCLQFIEALHFRLVNSTNIALNTCERTITIMEKHESLASEIEQQRERQVMLIARLEKAQNKKLIPHIGKIVDYLSATQIITACVMVSVTSLLQIPNDLANNKLVGFLSLLSFAFLLFSLFINNYRDSVIANMDQIVENTDATDNYYLELLDRASD